MMEVTVQKHLKGLMIPSCSKEKMDPQDLVSVGGQDCCSTTLSNEKTTGPLIIMYCMTKKIRWDRERPV